MRDYLTLLSNTNLSTKTVSIRSPQDMEVLENGFNILLNEGIGQLGSFPYKSQVPYVESVNNKSDNTFIL